MATESAPESPVNASVESFPGLKEKASLFRRIPLDVTAAGLASLLVSPFVTIVDKSIISNASGREPLWSCMVSTARSFLLHPLRFIRRPEFVWIWALYAATYTTSNFSESLCAVTGTSDVLPKFAATTVVNIAVCVSKDRAFTRMFGTKAPSALPLASYVLFTARDMLTVFTSFTLPRPVSQMLPIENPTTALNVAQLGLPVAVQFISTPMHLLGLDLYNRKGESWVSRARFVRGEYVKSVAARMGRIGPAFGIGGVGNRTILQALRERFL